MEQIEKSGLIPVVVLERVKDAVPTARALLAGGIGVMEITFRTDAAAAAIETVASHCPQMTVGAGTVVTMDQCKNALEKGAKFIVSPGFNEKIVAFCIENRVPIFPGCVTPGEIMNAMDMGLKILKFFPANVYGGIKGIQALAAPFPTLRFIPTGGIRPDNLAEYNTPFVYAVGGSWMCSKQDIRAGEFERITSLCVEARKILGRE